jgi:ADP-heptose:LPS heptosyltransferase
VIIRNDQSPGDVVVLTAAIKALHEAYPKQFVTDVRTPCPELWENSLSRPVPDDAETIDATYTGIHRSSEQPVHFLQAFCDDLADALKIKRFSSRDWMQPSILLSDEEKGWIRQVEEPGPYWIINAGVKRDYTAKRWDGYQEVVDQTRDSVTWVQIGSEEHDHRPLEGVIDLIGKTDLRQLVRLVYHAEGVLCGVTALMHLAHWVERGPDNPFRRHAVIIAGGREAPSWFSYPGHHVLSTIGELDCCAERACWKSRVVPLGDGDEKDGSLCVHPVGEVGQCMRLIAPEMVSQLVLRLRSSGVSSTVSPTA